MASCSGGLTENHLWCIMDIIKNLGVIDRKGLNLGALFHGLMLIGLNIITGEHNVQKKF